jgi:hypothetical protein
MLIVKKHAVLTSNLGDQNIDIVASDRMNPNRDCLQTNQVSIFSKTDNFICLF